MPPNDPHRRGRPRLDPSDPTASAQLHVRLPGKLFDRVYHEASKRRIDLSEYVREAVRKRLDDDDRDR